jgi:hypothetical protein
MFHRFFFFQSYFYQLSCSFIFHPLFIILYNLFFLSILFLQFSFPLPSSSCYLTFFFHLL